MSDTAAKQVLLAQATAGDREALVELLIANYDQLAAHTARKMSSQDRRFLSVDDIVQQTFAQVIQDIGRFTPRTDDSFCAWLKKIAEHRLQDAVRRRKREQRAGNIGPRAEARSVAELVELLSAGSHTPSGSAARHEAIAAVQHSINALPDDYRQAVQLRLLQGKSLEETAVLMHRSPRAVQGLVDRAKKKMRAALGRISLYE